ncbi:MAG: hypothetical protein Q9162_001928 [Coniocarpon cinnabarinum]
MKGKSSLATLKPDSRNDEGTEDQEPVDENAVPSSESVEYDHEQVDPLRQVSCSSYYGSEGAANLSQCESGGKGPSDPELDTGRPSSLANLQVSHHLRFVSGSSSRSQEGTSKTELTKEKAINDYGNRQLRQDTDVSGKGRQPSSSPSKARLGSGANDSGQAGGKDTQSQIRPRLKSVFKPLDTEHTFDHLEVPGRPTLSRSQPLLNAKLQKEEHKREQQTIRSRSSPGPQIVISGGEVNAETRQDDIAVTESSVDNHALQQRMRNHLAPGDHFPQLAVSYSWKPATLAEDKSRATSVYSVVHHDTENAGPKPTLGAWGKYPSHTRKERTQPAGQHDGVQVRDFADTGRSTPSDEELSPTNSLTSSKKSRRRRRKRAKMTARARLKIWQKRMNEVFKPWMNEYRKREKGHRSSIAPGGAVAFPELEMIPGSAASDVEGK